MGNQNSTERPNKHDETDITSESSSELELVSPEYSRASASPRPPTTAPAAGPSQLSRTPSNSTPALKRSQSARKVRAKGGTDERRKPKPEKMVTSLQAAETREVRRTRHEEQERAGSRHEEAITAQTENPESSSPHQKRTNLSKKVRVGPNNVPGQYGPTRDANPSNGDQPKSRLYGPFNSVNLVNGDESVNVKKTDAAPRKRGRPKHVNETIANPKTPAKVSRKLFPKTKRSPITPKKAGGQIAIKSENETGSSRILFPGLVKYMGPSGFSEDPDSRIGADEPNNKQMISQDDRTIATFLTSSNSGKPKRGRPTKVLDKTSAVSAKIQKSEDDGEVITKLENAINTPTFDLAGFSTPSAKVEIPMEDRSPSLDDGIRRSGRARKIRRWDGENYEVRLSKKARHENAS